jgi:serine/threonine protein kinase
LHDSKIIHRGIAPENILFASRDQDNFIIKI